MLLRKSELAIKYWRELHNKGLITRWGLLGCYNRKFRDRLKKCLL